MNVFLAGSTGAIGRPSVRILVNRGHRVFAMTRASKQEAELWKLGAIPVVKDAFDAEGLTQALRAIKPDAVIHQLTDLSLLSEPTKLQEAIERNARLRKIGTGNLLSAAIAAGADHMIAQSIAWVYQPGPEPYQETAPLDTHADGLLGVTVKGVVALESSVLATAGIQGCVLRYGHLYGPGTSSDEVAGKEMPVHVDAAAWASVLALEQRATGIYNVAEPNGHVNTDKIRSELGWSDTFRA